MAKPEKPKIKRSKEERTKGREKHTELSSERAARKAAEKKLEEQEANAATLAEQKVADAQAAREARAAARAAADQAAIEAASKDIEAKSHADQIEDIVAAKVARMKEGHDGSLAYLETLKPEEYAKTKMKPLPELREFYAETEAAYAAKLRAELQAKFGVAA